MRAGVVVVLAAGVAILLLTLPEEEPEAERKPVSERVASVEVAPVTVGTVTERATYPAELATEAADVAARVAGRLLSVEPRVGDHVEAGAKIAQVDVTDLKLQLAEARAAVRAAKAAGRRARTELAAAKRELERTEALVDDQLVSRQQVDTLKARVDGLATDGDAADAQRDQASARVAMLTQRIEDAMVVAPFGGVVSVRHLDAGAYAHVGTPIVRLVAQRPLRVRFEVPERDVALLGGAAVVVRSPATGPLEVAAAVRGIGGEVTRQRRTVVVEADVVDPPEGWLPGMSAEVVSPTRTVAGALTVPAEALVERLDDAGQPERGVFAVVDGGARWTPVAVDGREGKRVAVSGELAEGAQVIVRGQGNLSDGAKVRVVEGGG
ncbi:MAG: hypothetical protein AMXMBFR64_08190 [Myxococcales bacterium]